MDVLDQTLEELEGHDWGEPTFDSYVVTTGHRLRRKRLRDFTPEDLRFMLGQQIGLPYLMPLALDVLEREPFAGGDMYPGALLANALRVDAAFWQDHRELWDRLSLVIGAIQSMRETIEEELLPAARAFAAADPLARGPSFE